MTNLPPGGADRGCKEVNDNFTPLHQPLPPSAPLKLNQPAAFLSLHITAAVSLAICLVSSSLRAAISNHPHLYIKIDNNTTHGSSIGASLYPSFLRPHPFFPTTPHSFTAAMRSSPVLLLLALALPALTSPIPQEGNEQMDRFNVSPTPTLDAVPSATATPSAASVPEPVDPAMQALAKPPQINADDGMKTGMGAAMSGLGSVTSGLSGLPVVGGLGGLGGRDVAVKKRWALLEGLPVVGPLMSSGLMGRVKRTLFPTLATMPDVASSMPDMGSSGVVNVGHKAKREANLLSSLPLLGGLTGGKVKRQLDGLTGVLGILGNLGGGLGGSKAKRDPAFEALGEVPGVATTLLKAFGKQSGKRGLDLPIVGGLLDGGLGGISPRGEDPLAQIKKMAAVVADIRGVTSKREAEADAAPEGDFRQGLRKAADAKIDGELNKVEDKAERKIKIKNTKFPGGKVKSPKEALDKREAEALGLDALPVKDAVEGATGLKSTMDLVKNLSSQVENRNGK